MSINRIDGGLLLAAALAAPSFAATKTYQVTGTVLVVEDEHTLR